MKKDCFKEWENVEDKTNDKKILTDQEREEYAKNKAFEKLVKEGEIELATSLLNKEEK